MITIDQERLHDSTDIEGLLDAAFGPERFTKSSYTLRENLSAIHGLNFVARDGERLVGTVRQFPIHVYDMLSGACENAVLLGPLAVSPNAQSCGIGGKLVSQALQAAKSRGHKRVLLVGEADYYKKFGFEPVLPRYITLPGGRDARRLLVWQAATIAALPTVGKILPGWCEARSGASWEADGLLPAA